VLTLHCVLSTNRAAAVNAKPESYAVAVEGAGHWMQVTHAAEVNSLLQSFLIDGAQGAAVLKQRALATVPIHGVIK
jgi:hypothetical protein